jgi:DNA-binding transcriptional MerR regulator
MQIGELAARTGVRTRLLRYYEDQGLLASARASNGYRAYDEDAIARVGQIRELLDAGLPIKIIKQLLPCLDDPGPITAPSPELLAEMEEYRDLMDARIRCLARNRDAITTYLDKARGADR